MTDHNELVERCLGAFVKAGRLDLSLDQLAGVVGVSKRMLVHYFGGREAIEEAAITLLERRLRHQFAPEKFPAGTGCEYYCRHCGTGRRALTRGAFFCLLWMSRRGLGMDGRAPGRFIRNSSGFG